MIIHRERGNKYGNETCQGYPSKLEKNVGDRLKLLEKAGKISNLRRQQSVRLGTKFWRCDFCYEENGETVFAEAKGYDGLGHWPWIKEMWKLVGPGRLEIWMGTWKNPYRSEILERGIYAAKVS
jgi:hypothetical protein